MKRFQSTLPARGATAERRGSHALVAISIHAPRTGSDSTRKICMAQLRRFQSTLPARGATDEPLQNGGTLRISIHAPRTGSDRGIERRFFWRVDFNPRSPHGERRAVSTGVASDVNFNPRSPHGERRLQMGKRLKWLKISIHAPRTGSDPQIAAKFHRKLYFNPRSPHGERLPPSFAWNPNNLFQSTLPARGATLLHNASQRGNLHFNPRSPHGERPSRRTSTRKQFLFQSTLPARGATKEATAVYINEEISIHAPRTGSDAKLSLLATFLPDFNPRSPHGERHRINMIA